MAASSSSKDIFYDADDSHPLAQSADFDEGKDAPNGAPRAAADNSPSSPNEHIPLTESAVEDKYDEYELPESTYTLLMTQPIISIPFATGLLGACLSLWYLALALKNELDNGEKGNPLGMPAGVQSEVRVAQYLGKFTII